MIARVLGELAKLRNPRTLWFGVISGYALTACFAILLAIAIATGALPWHWTFGVLLGAKLLTNTLAWIALRFDKGALELGGLNVVMDVVVMTGAIWATGDIASPLVAIYTLEITVLALLTNLTCTVLIAAVAWVLFVAMGWLVSTGVLPQFPTPVEWSGRSTTYVGLAIGFTAFVIFAPTFYTAGLLRRVRDRERALEAKTVELVDAGKQKAQFMANITHELRTPLQGIMGLSDLVAKGIYGDTVERQRQAMADIKGSAKRLHALIDDLLQLAMHDAGKLEVKLEKVDLGELATSAAASAQWLLAGKQLDIAVEVDVLAGLDGRVIAAVPRARLRVDSGVAVAGVTVHDDELIETASAVARAIGLTTVANVQLKRDADGRPALLEVNPRFPGAMPLTIAAGVDMPSLTLDAVLGRPVPDHVDFQEIANVRYLEDVFLPIADVLPAP